MTCEKFDYSKILSGRNVVIPRCIEKLYWVHLINEKKLNPKSKKIKKYLTTAEFDQDSIEVGKSLVIIIDLDSGCQVGVGIATLQLGENSIEVKGIIGEGDRREATGFLPINETVICKNYSKKFKMAILDS